MKPGSSTPAPDDVCALCGHIYAIHFNDPKYRWCTEDDNDERVFTPSPAPEVAATSETPAPDDRCKCRKMYKDHLIGFGVAYCSDAFDEDQTFTPAVSRVAATSDNELIAEFMGAKHRIEYGPLSGDPFLQVLHDKEWKIAKYDTSWDWLMPVVEKIESIKNFDYTVQIGSKREYPTKRKKATYWTDFKLIATCRILNPIGEEQTGYYTSESKIESVYKAVVEFIKWFNEHGKK